MGRKRSRYNKVPVIAPTASGPATHGLGLVLSSHVLSVLMQQKVYTKGLHDLMREGKLFSGENALYVDLEVGSSARI